MLVYKPGRKLLVASNFGNGFLVPEEEVVAQTRKGKQVLNLGDGERAVLCRLAQGDTVAVWARTGVFSSSRLPSLTK